MSASLEAIERLFELRFFIGFRAKKLRELLFMLLFMLFFNKQRINEIEKQKRFWLKKSITETHDLIDYQFSYAV